MAQRIETWFGNLYDPSAELPPEYKQLAPRELVIVACGLLDAALAEVLSLRFRDDRNETDAFLGIEGDSRAPAGTFGARIQLAYLLGLIDAPMVQGLRGLKRLRNLMAHRVRVDLLSPDAQACLDTLRGVFLSEIPSDAEHRADVESMCQASRTDLQAAKNMLLMWLLICQYMLAGRHPHITRVDAPFE
jgi:hypothetical protein